MDIDEVRLGGTYSDSATGYTGKATAKTSYVLSKNGDVRLEGTLHDGRHSDAWVRSERLAKALPLAPVGRMVGPSETKG